MMLITSWSRGSFTLVIISMNYCMNSSLNNGLYCTKQAYPCLLFGQLLCGLKSSIMACVPIFLQLSVLKCSHNSSHPIN